MNNQTPQNKGPHAPRQNQPAAGGVTPLSASDTELIEKEWVEKAKKIIEGTKADPHEQQEAINKFKAEYMKKRYNKIMKPK